MKDNLTSLLFTALIATFLIAEAVQAENSGLTSIDTGYTICKVRSAVDRGKPYIVASTYEGAVLRVSYQGKIIWKNKLSGFMNRDLWCADITGDGADEVLAANADGTIYCLDAQGNLVWRFKANDAPMNAVCVIAKDKSPYVVCGSFDKSIYYLSSRGEPVITVPSSSYSQEKSWGKSSEKRIPPKFLHIANFLRTVRGPQGRETLAVHGVLNSNAGRGSIYLFHPLEDMPFQTIKIEHLSTYGDFSVSDVNGDGVEEILLGSSSMIQDAGVLRIDTSSTKQQAFLINNLRRKIDGFGYRVAQTVSLGEVGYFVLFGSRILLVPRNLDLEKAEILSCGFSFNDLWKDPATGKILLGSAQSGGSCIHVIDTTDPQWKTACTSFRPSGKLKTVLDNTAAARRQLQQFSRPPHERAPRPVYMLTESLSGDVEQLAHDLEEQFGSPVFLNGHHMPTAEAWDRSNVTSEKYREQRDRRRKYTLTQQQALEELSPLYDGHRQGAAFWGGHGNDPYMFSTNTIVKVADTAAAKQKLSVFIYPELESYDDDFATVLREHFYPMAEYFHGKNQYIYVRTKHAFWQSVVYLPLWSRLLSGEFADVFVPSMEETTDKTMEQSVAGRIGLWASGAVNQWGSRCARDNASFDRLRQHSHQMVPNHFLRTQIFNIAYGATFQNNFPVDQAYFSVLYELIAKGALYVPQRNEIVSFNPVHLSMTAPDPHYLDEGNNAKWLTFYDEEFERNKPMVFSRLNGSWPGAPVTDWDFSRYAAGVKDRRLHFLPPYPHGLVLITPPQYGTFADVDAPRGKLTDHLHPLYQNVMREHLTNGRVYLSADGTREFAANEYYRQVEADIENNAKLLPLTVSGDVAWVVAQTAPTHLRLTLIDGGYIDPRQQTARVQFHTVKPKKIVDLLSGATVSVADPSHVEIDVPCGLFRFLDVELEKPL